MLIDRTAISVTMHEDSAAYLAKLDALVRGTGGPVIDVEVNKANWCSSRVN